MISHSQNFEDVMLYRALRHVDKGLWIDVGAWHPQLHSVTKWFYDCGWTGINVEPTYRFYRMLQRHRPKDLNLNVAVGRNEGIAKFFQIDKTGLSSLSNESVARGQALGFKKNKTSQVRVVTMAQLFEDYVCGREVHFVKVDVEGFEADVIAGFDFSKHRPWIIVVEAIEPLSNLPAWSEWESIVLHGGYRYAWFDGINRFYVREESAELLEHFKIPVNLFDQVRIPYVRTAFSEMLIKYGEIFGY